MRVCQDVDTIIVALYGIVVVMTLGFDVVSGTCSGFQFDVVLPIPNRCETNTNLNFPCCVIFLRLKCAVHFVLKHFTRL
jgi:hypothetical protein